ncbi:MAG: HIRAN domain-containing protein [Bacteroidetes bacterium]|nr:HIRAN domain-containing protein [Bacteroidota bacterium]
MKRNEFLNKLGLSAAGIIIPKQFASAKPIKIYDNYVRGIYHYDFSKVRTQMKEGDELSLIREPENVYDSFATAVFWQQHKMGYLAAYENIVIANMLDKNVELKAFISQVQNKASSPEGMAIEVFAELVVAKQPLLDLAEKQQRADDKDDVYRS